MPLTSAHAPIMMSNRWRSVAPVMVVLFAVCLNAASGIVLKSLASHSSLSYAFIITGLIIALLINGLRFLTWTYAHRRWPLSTTYPLTSLFYPVILAVSFFYHEPIGPNQWLGAALITAGAVLLSWRVAR